jgi:hypothetical protein
VTERLGQYKCGGEASCRFGMVHALASFSGTEEQPTSRNKVRHLNRHDRTPVFLCEKKNLLIADQLGDLFVLEKHV